MTAPIVSALATFPRGPGQLTDNLTGLANNQIRGMGIVGTVLLDIKDIKVGTIQITTGTVPNSPNGSGTAGIFIASSEDGTNWTDAMDPNSTDGAAQASLFVSGQSMRNNLVQRISCPASATAYTFDCFSILQQIGYVPSFIGVFVTNNTGGAYNAVATNFRAQYTQVIFA